MNECDLLSFVLLCACFLPCQFVVFFSCESEFFLFVISRPIRESRNEYVTPHTVSQSLSPSSTTVKHNRYITENDRVNNSQATATSTATAQESTLCQSLQPAKAHHRESDPWTVLVMWSHPSHSHVEQHVWSTSTTTSTTTTGSQCTTAPSHRQPKCIVCHWVCHPSIYIYRYIDHFIFWLYAWLLCITFVCAYSMIDTVFFDTIYIQHS